MDFAEAVSAAWNANQRIGSDTYPEGYFPHEFEPGGEDGRCDYCGQVREFRNARGEMHY